MCRGGIFIVAAWGVYGTPCPVSDGPVNGCEGGWGAPGVSCASLMGVCGEVGGFLK